MFKIFIRRIYRILCVNVSRFFSPRSKIINKFFDFLRVKSSDSIYFIKYDDKNRMIKFLNKKSEIENESLVRDYNGITVNSNMKSVIEDLNHEGISEKIKIDITNEEINFFTDHLNKSHYYDNHVPSRSQKKDSSTKPDGAYKSYDYSTQLNNPTLLKLCINEKIVKIAEQYLGVIPKIYSINTFNTLPGQKAFTHDFHRDIDNLKWLVVFIYWTRTSSDDGAFEQIKYTHKPSKYLEDLLNKDSKIFSNNFDVFFKKTIPGYGQNQNYEKLFSSEIYKVYGEPGKIVTCDTLGLHRGTSVKKERIVTWIRYGVMASRQKTLKSEEILEDKISLNERCGKILRNSKFKDVLSDIVKIS